jgi:hypothetical protein
MAMPFLVLRQMVAVPAPAEAYTARAVAKVAAVRQVQVDLAKQAAVNLVDRRADNRLLAPVVVAKAVVRWAIHPAEVAEVRPGERVAHPVAVVRRLAALRCQPARPAAWECLR